MLEDHCQKTWHCFSVVIFVDVLFSCQDGRGAILATTGHSCNRVNNVTQVPIPCNVCNETIESQNGEILGNRLPCSED